NKANGSQPQANRGAEGAQGPDSGAERARSAVASLCRGADASAAKRIVRFHRKPLQGPPKDEAQCQAIAAVQKDPKTVCPSSGAAFFLTRDPDNPNLEPASGQWRSDDASGTRLRPFILKGRSDNETSCYTTPIERDRRHRLAFPVRRLGGASRHA